MIITQLNGGLGNQMFQYAAGRVLSKKYNTSLFIDKTLFNLDIEQTPRQYRIDAYNISAKGLVFHSILAKALNRILLDSWINIYHENSYEYDSGFSLLKNNTKLIGYWQSYRYTNLIRNQLIADFTLKNKVLSQKINHIYSIAKNENSVSLHVRRGDYITNTQASEILGTLPLSYYQAATNYIKKHVKNPQYIIFSDDINWSRNNLKTLLPSSSIYCHESELIDLDIMTKTRHNIIANSSYSWWGAYLGDKVNVIAPKRWFKTSTINSKDLIPPTWIQI